jgi:ribosomal protein S18 acetylase RimI-like enzyme
MIPLLIRRAEVDDASALSELATRTFREAFGSDNNSEDLDAHLGSAYSVDKQTAEIKSPDVTTLLALQGEELVGFAQIQRSNAPSCVVAERAIELRRFYFINSAHGKGFASKLMQAARQAAFDLGGAHLWLGVWERNPRAIAFYSKSGFTKVGSHIFTVGADRQTDYVFVSSL